MSGLLREVRLPALLRLSEEAAAVAADGSNGPYADGSGDAAGGGNPREGTDTMWLRLADAAAAFDMQVRGLARPLSKQPL